MKPHILTSPDPLVAGSTYTAQCGAEVKRAQFPFIVDDSFGHPITLNARFLCPKCISVEMGAGRYVYGLLEKEESIERAEVDE